MGTLFSKKVHIAAAAQFAGTEFKAFPRKDMRALKSRQITLKMGSEAKTWKILYTFIAASGSVVQTILRQSLDGTGAPAANTDTDVILTGADAEVLLTGGGQIQVITSGATAAMDAEILYEEVDATPVRGRLDPDMTR